MLAWGLEFPAKCRDGVLGGRLDGEGEEDDCDDRIYLCIESHIKVLQALSKENL